MKRISLILLSLIMVLSVVIVPAAAETAAPMPGTATLRDIQAYYWEQWGYHWPGFDLESRFSNEDTKAEHEGYPKASEVDLSTTVDTNFQVATLADLVAIQTAVNSGNTLAGKSFYMTADIDMEEDANGDPLNWVPIGYIANEEIKYSFGGTFNGWAHTISNLTIIASYFEIENMNAGLFGAISAGATVADLIVAYPHVEGANTKDGGGDTGANRMHGTGVIVGYAASDSTISNCKIVGNAASIVTDNMTVGGIVGQSGGNVTMCTNEGVTVRGANGWAAVGGIVGVGGWVTRCVNTGDVCYVNWGIGNAGGINGYGAPQIEKCINLGNVTVAGAAGCAGGIVGYAWVHYFNNCVNYGKVVATAGDPAGNLGSVIGHLRNAGEGTFKNLTNYGFANKSNRTLQGFVGNYQDAASETSIDWTTCTDHGMVNMLKVRYQTNDANSIRLTTALDSLDYETVVFEITYQGNTAEVDCRKVCESILAADETLTASDLSGSDLAKYIVTFNLVNIPEDAEFTVAVKTITPDMYPHGQYYYNWIHSAPETVEMGA